MKNQALKMSALAGLAATFIPLAMAGEDATPLCPPVAAAVQSAVQAEPSTVLAVVSAKVAEAPSCACDVVKTAIVASKASKELTGQIVEAAVRAAPGQYKIIVECAVAVNADAAAEIRAALQRVFGGKDGKGGKVVVEPPPAARMSPAVALAFIMEGLTPLQGLENRDPLRPMAAIPGGGTSSVFGIETPIPAVKPPAATPKPPKTGGGTGGGGGGRPPVTGGGTGGSTPANPVQVAPITQ